MPLAEIEQKLTETQESADGLERALALLLKNAGEKTEEDPLDISATWQRLRETSLLAVRMLPSHEMEVLACYLASCIERNFKRRELSGEAQSILDDLTASLKLLWQAREEQPILGDEEDETA